MLNYFLINIKFLYSGEKTAQLTGKSTGSEVKKMMCGPQYSLALSFFSTQLG